MSKLRNTLRKAHPAPAPGPCPICDNHTETWVLDHCHTTNQFRGYICDRCNRGLGCFGDNKDTVAKAINYLSTNEKQITNGSEDPHSIQIEEDTSRYGEK